MLFDSLKIRRKILASPDQELSPTHSETGPAGQLARVDLNLEQLLSSEICLSPAQGVVLVMDACRLLLPASRKRICHGSLSPETMMVDHSGGKYRTVKLSRSRALSTGQNQLPRLLTDDDALRAFSYLSPEQQEGKRPSSRSDVYSLGAILYVCLTGSLPDVLARNDQRPTLLKMMKKTLFLKSYHVPVNLEALVARCLAADPADRFSGPAEMLQALEALFEPIDEDFRKACMNRRKQARRTIIATAAGIAALGAALSIFLFEKKENEPLSPPAVSFNKNKFAFGDKLELTVNAPQNSRTYVFYIDKSDTVTPFSPSSGHRASGPQTISIKDVSGKTMHVDSEEGNLLLVSIRDGCMDLKEQKNLVRSDERSAAPNRRALRISGQELVRRATVLTNESPTCVSVSIKAAPRATETMLSSDE